MVALKKWMIMRFTPYQTTILPKRMFSQKLLFKSPLLLNGYIPQPTAMTFAFSLSYFYASGLLLGGHDDLTDFASWRNRTWSTPYPQDYVRHTCVDKIP